LLGDKVTRATAADALVHHGPEALPAIGAILGDRRRDRAIRLQAPRILQRIGGPLAAQILVDQLPEQDEVVRAAICGALAQLRMSGTIVPIDESALDLRIMAEISDCYRLHVWYANLHVSHEDALLSDALLERIDRAFDRIVSLLEVRYPGHGLARTRQTLRRSDRGAGGMAAELLDSVVERRVRELLLPLLEAPVAKVLAIAATHLRIPQRSVLERLRELAQSPDPWLRACAIFRIGTLQDPRLAPLVTPALKSDDALAREAALVACGQLLDPDQLNAVLIEQATADGFPTVRRYAQALLREMDAV
jgi:HEAT repeat protein